MSYEIEEKNSDKNVIMIYTDGACRSHGNDAGGSVNPTDKGAYGYYMSYKGAEKEKVFPVYGKTNNYCEIMGVYEALNTLRVKNLPIKLHSDSAYVVNCLNDGWYKGWRNKGWTKKGGLKNVEEWKKLVELFEQFPFISIIKVKGHSTDKYNNHVDEILNIAMDQMEEKQ